MIRLRSNLIPNDWTQESMTRVYLIRPGATCFDLENRIAGDLDLPLCKEGVEQINRLKDQLTDLHLAALYHSPNLSAQRTAEALGPVLKLRPKCVLDLRNVNLGLWQGLCWEELKQRHPKAWKQWIEEPSGIHPPQGESFGDASERIVRFLDTQLRRYRNESVGLIIPDPLAQILSCQLRGCDKPRLTELPDGGTIEVIDLEFDAAGRQIQRSEVVDS